MTFNDCWFCNCLFADGNFNANSTILELYEPDADTVGSKPGTGPINKTKQPPANQGLLNTCYEFQSTSTSAPVTSSPTSAITSVPTKAPITSSPTVLLPSVSGCFFMIKALKATFHMTVLLIDLNGRLTFSFTSSVIGMDQRWLW